MICETQTETLNLSTAQYTYNITLDTTGTGTFNNPVSCTRFILKCSRYHGRKCYLTLTGNANSPCIAASTLDDTHITRQAVAYAGSECYYLRNRDLYIEQFNSHSMQLLLTGQLQDQVVLIILQSCTLFITQLQQISDAGSVL